MGADQLSTAETMEELAHEQAEIAERKRLGLPSAQDSFNAMLKNELAPALRALGFSGSGRAFRMSLESHLAAIEVQSSAWNSALKVRFTINVAVSDRALWQARQDLSRVAERFFTTTNALPTGLCERIGDLANAEDRWWSVFAGKPTAEISESVLTDITQFAIPWIQAKANSSQE